MIMKYFNCASYTDSQKYGMPICNSCESDLRLFTDDTIIRQKREFKGPDNYASYQDEISGRLIPPHGASVGLKSASLLLKKL